MKLISMLLHPGCGDDSRGVVQDNGRTYTRAQLVSAVGWMIDRLAEHGLKPGHRVMALLDHDLRGLLFLAAASASGLRVLMPYNLSSAAVPEWLNIAATARPDFTVSLRQDGGQAQAVAALRRQGLHVAELPFVDEALAEAAPPCLVQMRALDPIAQFLVLFTSGTTGAPKAISLSEAVVCERVRSVSQKLRFEPESRIFMSGLLNNTTGFIFSFGALLHDAVLVFPADREIATWPAQVAAARATHIMLRPVALKRFVAAARATASDLSSLRVVAYGAAAMPRAVLQAGRELMPCDWFQGYGLSETFGPFCWLDEAAHRDAGQADQLYRVGRPDDTVELSLRPLPGHGQGVGEVLVRSAAVMEGYLDVRTGALTPPGPWLHTGDLGAFSPNGELLLKGRIDNTVMSENGHRVYPEEVEAVLGRMDGVAEVVLLGLPGALTMDVRPVACFHGALACADPETICLRMRRALAEALSREKWPDWVYASRAPFPKSSNDKVLKAEVARRVLPKDLIPL